MPDHYDNRKDAIRQFGVVALFDRKRTEDAAFNNRAVVSKAFYLWICRSIATSQSINPKFFYVIGGDSPPWDMIEIDIFTGDRLDDTVLWTEDWKEIWSQLGLSSLRESIVGLVQKRAA